MSEILEIKRKTIDGIEFAVSLFPGLHGLRIKGRLLKFIGPAIKGVFASIPDEKGKSLLDANINLSMIGEALGSLTEKLDDPKVLQLIQDLLQTTQADGKMITKQVIDFTFAGKYITLYKAILFVIEANAFFGERNISNLIDGNIPQEKAV